MSFSNTGDQLQREIDKVFAQLSSPAVRRAHSRALTLTARGIKPVAVRKSAAKLSISQKHLRPRVKVTGAKVKNLTAKVWGGTSDVPLIKLKAKEVDGGVQAGKYLLPGAFIATATNTPKQRRKGRKTPSSYLVGKSQVFLRKGDSAYPVQAQGVNVKRVLDPLARQEAHRAMRNDMRRHLLAEYKKQVLKGLGK